MSSVSLWFKFACVFLLLLPGCSTPPQPRTEISVTLRGNAFQPAAWRVPAGEQITVHFSNEDTIAHDWTVMKLNVTAPFSADDQANVYWSITLPAGANLAATFRAPAAPANYPVVCTTPGHLEAGMLGRLTVVQPTSNP